LIKNHHAIIFTGSKPPEPQKNEIPNAKKKPRERGMRTPIRVKQTDYHEKLDPMSRLNYKKIYTVEHNVKVRDFGQVHKKYEEQLVSNFHEVWGFQTVPLETSGDDTDDEEEGVDGEEENEEGLGEDGAEYVEGAGYGAGTNHDEGDGYCYAVVEDEDEGEDIERTEVEAHAERPIRASEQTKTSGKGKERTKQVRRR
jgi:hypothetical protein